MPMRPSPEQTGRAGAARPTARAGAAGFPGSAGRARGAPRRRPAIVASLVAGALAIALAACSGGSGEATGSGAGGGGSATTARRGAAGAYPDDGAIRMNHLQQLGSHNSYHVAPDPKLAEGLNKLIPGMTKAWEYTHAPLEQQFDAGVRQIELDVHADPQGGLYDIRHANASVGLPSESGVPEMKQPGLKVFHVAEVDYRTTCATFVMCLRTVKAWSDAHPGHLPILILVEAKADKVPDPLNMGFSTPIEFDAAQLDLIDKEILSVFSPDDLVTPDQVRGNHRTLDEAVTTDGWPSLAASRGKLLFALDNAELGPVYTAGHPSLQNRVLFVDAEPGTPEAAFVKRNDAKKDQAAIQALVKKGYLVRTRADGDTSEARRNDRSGVDAALASGAQYVSTDYELPDTMFGHGYVVRIPDGTPARCNPVNAPPGCTAAKLEDPARLAGAG